MTASYPVCVLVVAVGHIFSQRVAQAFMHLFSGLILPEQPPNPWWQRLRTDWPELLYGPAITLVCVWAMVMLEMLIRLRFGRGAGSTPPRSLT